MASSVIIKAVIWCYCAIVEIIYLPIIFLRLFKTSKKCPPIRNDILLLRASELAHRIRRKEISSVTAVQAYISRINEVNPIINAVLENRFLEALEDARKADDIVEHSRLDEEEIRDKYPLLGVPITIKGSIAVAGMNFTGGRIDYQERAQKDAVGVQRAKEAGAIVLLISNIPELCLNWETRNKLIGATSNPYNTTRTSGGSSGGEASLLGCGASLIGIGSDIAGSIRLPAHYCGVFGHKPSPYVVSTVGHNPDGKNKERWLKFFTLGAMARYATDLRILLSTIAEPEMKTVLKLEQQVDVKKIKLYYIEDFNAPFLHRVNKTVRGAIEKVLTHFDVICESKSRKVEIPLMRYCVEVSYLSLLDVGEINGILEGKEHKALSELFRFLTGRSNYELTSIMFEVLRTLIPTVFANSMKKVYIALQKLRENCIEILGDDGVFILPTSPCEAPYHNNVYRTLFDGTYVAIFNALGFPSTNCPVKFSAEGLPVSIQVVAAPNLDRLTLCVAEEIEKAFGGWKFN